MLVLSVKELASVVVLQCVASLLCHRYRLNCLDSSGHHVYLLYVMKEKSMGFHPSCSNVRMACHIEFHHQNDIWQENIGGVKLRK